MAQVNPWWGRDQMAYMARRGDPQVTLSNAQLIFTSIGWWTASHRPPHTHDALEIHLSGNCLLNALKGTKIDGELTFFYLNK